MSAIEVHPIAVEFGDMCREGILPSFEVEYMVADTIWYLMVGITVHKDTVYLELDNLGTPYFSGGWTVEYDLDKTRIVATSKLDNFVNLQDCLEEVLAECTQYILDCGYTLADA